MNREERYEKYQRDMEAISESWNRMRDRMAHNLAIVSKNLRPVMVNMEVAGDIFPERYADELGEPEEDVFT